MALRLEPDHPRPQVYREYRAFRWGIPPVLMTLAMALLAIFIKAHAPDWRHETQYGWYLVLGYGQIPFLLLMIALADGLRVGAVFLALAELLMAGIVALVGRFYTSPLW